MKKIIKTGTVASVKLDNGEAGIAIPVTFENGMGATLRYPREEGFTVLSSIQKTGFVPEKTD
jgi:hypothetical protein